MQQLKAYSMGGGKKIIRGDGERCKKKVTRRKGPGTLQGLKKKASTVPKGY